MNLRSGTPLWTTIAADVSPPRPALAGKEMCDVAVVGGGITGALVAHQLAESGFEVVVLEKRTIGAGSTAASTALLVHQTDTPLSDLVRWYGENAAFRIYHMGREAIAEIGELARRLNISCDYVTKPSLYLASDAQGEQVLEDERCAQERAGFTVKKISAKRLQSDFGLSGRGALYVPGAAQMNPHRLTRGLLEHHERRGAVRIFEQTTVTGTKTRGPRVELHTAAGGTVVATRAVVCAGYEATAFPRSGRVQMQTSYVVASAPMGPLPFWCDDCLIWETARPYLYVRTTPEGRILVGGEDEPLRNPRRNQRLRRQKWSRLEQRFYGMFPHLRFTAEFAWSGVFGETPDGLPYIGVRPRSPHLYYVLAYGGNGITFGQVGARIVRDLCLRRKNTDAALLSWDRLVGRRSVRRGGTVASVVRHK